MEPKRVPPICFSAVTCLGVKAGGSRSRRNSISLAFRYLLWDFDDWLSMTQDVHVCFWPEVRNEGCKVLRSRTWKIPHGIATDGFMARYSIMK
jgi:hypothetical protein